MHAEALERAFDGPSGSEDEGGPDAEKEQHRDDHRGPHRREQKDKNQAKQRVHGSSVRWRFHGGMVAPNGAAVADG